MTEKMTSKQITTLLRALVNSPRWHGITEEDHEAVLSIEIWGDIANEALQELYSAYASAKDAPHPNGSAIEIRDAVREQMDSLREWVEDYD